MAAHGPAPRILLADRGYNSDHIRTSLEAAGAVPMIPARRNRKNPVQIDDCVYGLRNRIERCFNTLRCSRRLATRYERPPTAISALSISPQSACGFDTSSTGPRHSGETGRL